jgi:hypothetical protein
MLSTNCEKPLKLSSTNPLRNGTEMYTFRVEKGGGGKNKRSCPPLDCIPSTFLIMELKKKIPGFDETCSANSLQILGRVRL